MEEGESQGQELDNLSRRERRTLLRDKARKEDTKSGTKKNLRKLIFGILILGGIGWGGYSLFKNSSSPLPGVDVTELGREHVTDIYGVEYSSNPPSSGPHFPVWAKPGVYDRFISDGYLIHSMEHGYVVIWYDCGKLSTGYSLLSTAYAHDEPTQEATDSGQLLMHMKVQPSGNMSWFTPQNPPEEEIALPESFRSDSCKNLVSEITEFTKVVQRVIVVPKQNMDSLIALTAWGRIDKMDSVNKERITLFIKSFHNRGPEKTTE